MTRRRPLVLPLGLLAVGPLAAPFFALPIVLAVTGAAALSNAPTPPLSISATVILLLWALPWSGLVFLAARRGGATRRAGVFCGLAGIWIVLAWAAVWLIAAAAPGD